MLESIYVCRHGFRSNWIDKSITTGPTGMQRDPPLAAYGLDQARNLSHFLSSPNSPARTSTSTSTCTSNPTPKLTAPNTSDSDSTNNPSPLPVPELIFSSPFYRCIQTALPLGQRLDVPIKLEHGVQEWYSQTIPHTGLHPRPSRASHLAQYFPPGALDEGYKSTVHVARRGEGLSELLLRAEVFVDAWTRRIEAEFPHVKTVVIFAHAASVIAIGRALTGNKSMHVTAGCASTSFYTRRRGGSRDVSESSSASQSQPQNQAPNQDRTNGSDSNHAIGDESLPGPVQDGEWECLWHGRADYLDNGLERDWSFKDVVLNDEGHVISDKGDGKPHDPSDELPLGLDPAYTRYLTKPDTYTPIVMRNTSAEVRRLAGYVDPASTSAMERADVEKAVIGRVEDDPRKGTKRRGSGVVLLESRM